MIRNIASVRDMISVLIDVSVAEAISGDACLIQITPRKRFREQ